MTERAAYYASLPEYYQVEEISKLLLEKATTPEQIILFIKKHKLSVNTFLKGFRPNEWIPIIHVCCHNVKYQEVVKFLIKNGANLHLLPDADPDVIEPLLFSCDLLYFKYLHDAGCRIPASNQSHNIKRKLRCADIKRLKLMVKLKMLTVNDVLSAVEDPILYGLKSMKEYLVYAFNLRKGVNIQEELSTTIDKFKLCINHLLSWHAPVTHEAVVFCIDYYLFEILSLPGFNDKADKVTPVIYHEHKDSLTVAILRPLLNDARYEKTCNLLNVTPDSELYARVKI